MKKKTAALIIFTITLAIWCITLCNSKGRETEAAPLSPAKRSEIARRLKQIPWFGNQLGLEDRVLPPWTPVTVSGTTVGCWGRNYEFGKSPFPEQIAIENVSVLARPITLVAFSKGKRIEWRAGTIRVDGTHSHARASVKGRLYGPNGLNINVTTDIGFDGLMRFELASAKNLDQVDSLALEIPLSASRAFYRHLWSPSWVGLSGALPKGNGIIDEDHFIPYYWIGDNDRGLFWFSESGEMWPNSERQDAIELARSDREVVLRLNIKKPGQRFPNKWKFAFGLQATPVKPLAKDWRKWRLEPALNSNVSIIWPLPSMDSLRYYGYPEAAFGDIFLKRINRIHAQGKLAVAYSCLTHLSAQSPEWKEFGDIWGTGRGDSTSADVKAYGSDFAAVSPVGDGWPDFIVWRNKKFIDRFGIDGLYHDNTLPYGSTAMNAGTGYIRDGKKFQTYPILGYRNLYRRMYAVLKDEKRPSFSMAHMSGKMDIPVLAYEDAYLDGEQFRGRVKDDYMDVISLDAFRAEFMGRQWGVIPVFLPEFRPPYSGQVEPTRGLMALLMLHDVTVWPLWCNVKVVNKALDALDKFGYARSDFIPYFAPDPPAATRLEKVYVSAYRKRNGEALLIISNLSREDRQGDICINSHLIGGTADNAVSWPSGTPLAVKNNCIKLGVPERGYEMVKVLNKKCVRAKIIRPEARREAFFKR
ncbi:MAG: DUF6067 family protein [Nitrospiraceae bacterium]|nr:DUF6067 family protein [Nitrospiraceae bacterium]